MLDFSYLNLISFLSTKVLYYAHPTTNNLGIFYGNNSLFLCLITKKQ